MALRNDVDESGIVVRGLVRRCHLVDDTTRGVGAVVVDDDDVKLECRPLSERGDNGIADGFLTVVNGNYHRCLYIEMLFAEVGVTVLRRIYNSPDGIEMSCGHLLHLHLHVAVAGVDIVELLFSASTGVEFLLGVEIFVEVHQRTSPAEPQPQFIVSGEGPVGIVVAACIVAQCIAVDEDERSEVEIVADASLLVVDNGMSHALSVLHRVVVAVDEHSLGLTGHLLQAF